MQGTSVDDFAMGQRQSRDIGTQTAKRQWGPPQPDTPWHGSSQSPRRGNCRQQSGRQTHPPSFPGVHAIPSGEDEGPDTDASYTAIGAILSQQQPDGTEGVIPYLSRSLTKAERRYCVYRRDMLALTLFVEECWPYLQCQPLIVRRDQSCLTWLHNFTNAAGQFARWKEGLVGYNSECFCHPGRH
ncbi:unnamed protein product [Schistocephalus solidus]|uniref:RT_RNaseH domain-containing protein n=1 Tax=Schistocephalus solidus TaxID=70667 RepID=A0A183TRY1_SCHSO|nr:unnamed protein product [Schistocephalus solidus]